MDQLSTPTSSRGGPNSQGYATRYGASVRQMDRSIAATAPHDDLIDLTHGDTGPLSPDLGPVGLSGGGA